MTESDVPAAGNLSEQEQEVLAQISEAEVIDFHRRLVQIPSVNPPGDVREAIALVESTLAAEGFETRIVSKLDIMPSLIATIGNDDGPVLAFNAHVDVVPIGEPSAWTHDPFGAEVVDGRIYGRGAGDDKASVTAQVMAAIALARSGVPLKGRLIVNEVADEEVGGFNGSGYIHEEGFFTPDYLIVGEQTMNEVALGEKGGVPTIIKVWGRTAHGALPWEGANAIEAIAEVIVALRRTYYPEIAQRTNPYFHPSSASVNLFSGGVKSNVVPDYAEIQIDRRLVPGEDPADVVAEMRAVAEEALKDFPGVRIEIDVPWPGGAATMTPEDSPLVRSMQGANERLGLSTNLRGFSMATDGRFWSREGTPTIIYGPGDPRLAHVPDEWVGVEEIMEATRAYALTALDLLT